MLARSRFHEVTANEGLKSSTMDLSGEDRMNPQAKTQLAKDTETTSMSINRGMSKEDTGHVYNGTLLSHKKRMKSCHSQQRGCN